MVNSGFVSPELMIETMADESKKQSLITIKGQSITKSDYRGIIALVLIILFGYSIFANLTVPSIVLGPFVGAIVTYYFHSKSEEIKNNQELG